MTTGRWRRQIRLVTAAIAVGCVALLVGSLLAGAATGVGSSRPPADALTTPAPAEGRPVTDRGLTVVTTQDFYTGAHPGTKDVADLFVFDATGELVYRNSTYGAYFDVDPVPGTRATIEYVAARRLGGEDCPTDPCSLNLVERLNLSTGETTRVYDAVTPQWDTGRWHDVDRVNDTHLVVADIVYDRVYAVDVRTDRITWQWNASDHYPITAGGGSGDWTHVNDVEVLPDGRIMVSLRNLDSVVFLDASGELIPEWTLGADDNHAVLFEQHNPDYLPADRGGPAVVLADSENNRVVEYRRRNGSWALTWLWRDRTLQWPRDADRLPNGHTLITDSHGDRVIEVDQTGTVVWSIEVGRPYEAERLGTGAESAGGWAAGSEPPAGKGAPPAADQGSGDRSVLLAVKAALPGPVVNGLLFVAPPWFGFTDLLVTAVLVLDLVVLGAAEWHWSSRSIRAGLAALGSRRR